MNLGFFVCWSIEEESLRTLRQDEKGGAMSDLNVAKQDGRTGVARKRVCVLLVTELSCPRVKKNNANVLFFFCTSEPATADETRSIRVTGFISPKRINHVSKQIQRFFNFNHHTLHSERIQHQEMVHLVG